MNILKESEILKCLFNQKAIHISYNLLFFYTAIYFFLSSLICESLTTAVEPISRYIRVSYQVPEDAPNEIIINCFWSPIGKNEWRTAKVYPYISETAQRFVREEEWEEWRRGQVKELCAQGLVRTIVFNPYPEAQSYGKVDIDFRVEIKSGEGVLIARQEGQIQVDNSDVIYIEDWREVFQKDFITTAQGEESRKWLFCSELEQNSVTFGNVLIGKKWREDLPLPQLSYPLNLKGWYAIYVCTPKNYGIKIRLSGDERSDFISSPRAFQEILWRWCKIDRQHLILQQTHSYQGYVESRLDYVKLVPLTEALIQQLEDQFGNPDKIVVAYFEPYSWAFFENIEHTLQHREPLVAYKDARVNILDIQLGRFGMKVVYESRVTDQLLYGTIGDPIGGVIPQTNNVGKMQQFTNTLESVLRYAHELGLIVHANFGATNCYPGTPLQSEVSKQHPEWIKNGLLRYDVPEVQAYILSLIKETLEIGADGVSIDFCRYPGGIDNPETCNQFLRNLKSLRFEFEQKRGGKHIPLLLRFPAIGVSHWEMFDYPTWVREELVDYLCPSNIQGRHMNFDVEPYLKVVQGTKCKLLPVVDGLSWGLDMPGPFLRRVKRLYEAGVDGIYIYQADSRLCINNFPDDRRWIRLISSSEAITNWWKNYEVKNNNYSRRIWLQPSEDGDLEYHSWERCRIWIEGVNPYEVKIYLDGQLINTYTQPPYILGGEDYTYDNLLSAGEHRLTIQARIDNNTLSQEFKIYGAN